MALPAPLVGGKDSDYDSNDDAGRYQGLDMTCTLNFVSQCPAVSVPSGFTAGGLPTGLQIVGRRYDEATVLRVAGALEVAQSWAGLRPPI
jgi:Asp-tRNA(Asn)/Glu-tRNA(Gln) amidotransferase A subunit family amidase